MFFFLYKLLGMPNILRYQTFRSFSAILTAFFISLFLGQVVIEWLKSFQKKGQPIRDDGPENHLETKVGIPTMGGILILVSVTVSTILWGNLKNSLLWSSLFVMWTYAGLGILDDLEKIRKYSSKGIRAKSKFLIQCLIGVCVTIFCGYVIGFSEFFVIHFPFIRSFSVDVGSFFILWGVLVIVGSSNAVNLTDGLDGLAIFPVMMASLSLAVIAYVVGNAVFSSYLFLPYVPHTGELIIFLGSWIGASLGFLWFNAPPARIFMGDTGSLAAGASLGVIALMTKHEIVWAIIGGIFVVEALSVIIQVASFKLRKKRIFLMAPIHHHFEKQGWKESTIVIRFWIISVLLALVGLASLKIR